MIAFSRTSNEVLAELGRAILKVPSNQETVSAEDVTRIVTIPPGVDARTIGVAFREAARDGIIAQVATAAKTRPIGGGHLKCLWKLSEAATGDRTTELA
jgi:hypothetical protein